jgi:carnitine-CoA ligase
MSLLLTRHDAHPFMGMDVPWLLEQRALTRRDHPFIVWLPFDGPEKRYSYGAFAARV